LTLATPSGPSCTRLAKKAQPGTTCARARARVRGARACACGGGGAGTWAGAWGAPV
jgi:hypothetical protein